MLTCDEYITYPVAKSRDHEIKERPVTNSSARPDDQLDVVWKALASSTRRHILDILVDGPVTTGDIAAEFTDLSRFAVMQHLGVLESADLVVAQKRGRRRFNHLNPVPIQRISDRWISRYHRPMAEAMVDLKLNLESENSATSSPVQGEETIRGASA